MHERYHIKRKDYLVKIFAFLLLSVYWFHPLVWISFYLMNRDMEMSCDAYVFYHFYDFFLPDRCKREGHIAGRCGRYRKWRSDIPVIEAGEIVFDYYDRLSNFAKTVSSNSSDDEIVFVQKTEEDTFKYIDIKYENQKFYYLEYDIKSDTGQEVQYTEKIFSNCIYETWRRREWTEAWQYFYLVDGSGITLQDIHEHVLSSQYQPDFPQFVTVYFEKVEEE